MQLQSRMLDLLRGLGWGVLIDLLAFGLIALLVMNGVGMAWAGGLIWAMAALAVTGISLAEGRLLIAGGFWLVQLGLFALFLAGYVKLLAILSIHI